MCADSGRQLKDHQDALEYAALSPQGLDREYARYTSRNNLVTPTKRTLTLGDKVRQLMGDMDEQAFAKKANVNPVVLRAVRNGLLPFKYIPFEFLIRIVTASEREVEIDISIFN